MSAASSTNWPGRGLSPSERGLLWPHRARVAEAMALLIVARLLVALVPFRHWRGWLGAIGDPRKPAPPLDEVAALAARRVGRAVDQAARKLPGAWLCLPRAMAAQWMLRCRAIPAAMFLGVLESGQRGTPDDLHAWVACGAEVIVGEGELPHQPVMKLTYAVGK